MLTRLGAGVLALAVAGAFVNWLDSMQPAEVKSAARMAGERWYRLTMEGEHIGYVYTHSERTDRGGWRFETLTHFSLNREAPVSISDRLEFTARPPYPLITAEHWNRRGDAAPEGVLIQAGEQPATATFVRGGSANVRDADWQYGLRDYLGLEVWLAEGHPEAGERFTARMPDFDRGEPVNRTFRIVERNGTGYLVASPAPLRATTIQLDRHLAPQRLSMAGVFDVTRTTRDEALAARTPLHLTNFRIPLDRRLDTLAHIESLRLTGGGGHDLSDVWPQARRRAGEWQLELSANPVSRNDNPAPALVETLTYPIFHPEVLRLVRQAVGDSEQAGERLARLVEFVHEYIAYRPQGPQRSVLETIAERSGDCTEYADLLTTLARAIGLPARTVMGLAYAETPPWGHGRWYPSTTAESGTRDTPAASLSGNGLQPTLAFHAWNEVAVDGAWQAVDPTWNQLRADATHIPMPDNQAALLHAMQGSNPLAFQVRDVRYAEGP